MDPRKCSLLGNKLSTELMAGAVLSISVCFLDLLPTYPTESHKLLILKHDHADDDMSLYENTQIKKMPVELAYNYIDINKKK